MFKLIQVIPPMPAPMTTVQNSLQSFAVAMPENLMPLLQKRIFGVMLNRYWGAKQVHDLTYRELNDLDALMTQYDGAEAHNMLLDGRELSILKRFLTAERVHLSQSTQPATPLPNEQYWGMISDLLLSTIRPTQLVNLSFCR